MPTVPFTPAQVTAIRYYAGYGAYAAYGYVFNEQMAYLDTQVAAMSDTEQATLVTEFLNVLPGLKTALDNVTTTLTIGVAGPFTRNPEEYAERKRQYSALRREMCDFINVTPGRGLSGGNSVVRT
jgi:hypothetical protein